MYVLEELQGYIEENHEVFFSLALVDVDRFHRFPLEVKGEIIRQLNEILKKQTKQISAELIFAGRDEYLIIFRNIQKNKAEEYVTSILAEISAQFSELKITCSAGIVQYPWDGRDASELWRKAEEAVNKAKRLGRNRVSVISEKMIMRPNYYTPNQLEKLKFLAKKLNKSEAEILRNSLEEYLGKYNI